MRTSGKAGMVFLLWLGLASAWGADAADSGVRRGVFPVPATNLFVPGPLRRIRIEVVGKELDRLRQDNRRYVRATFRVGDLVLNDVGIHLKGAAGSFRGLDDRPALTVNFDKFVPDQRWEGLGKIHLNNSVQDGSYLSEILCGEMFREAGVPAPRACNARLELNGRDLGIYVLKEGFDKTFLRQYYRSAKGNLYDGGFCRDITEPLEKLSGNDAKDQPELKALVAAAQERDLDRRFKKFEELLDLESFVSFCALEVMMWDWDGYVLKPNNYKLYWNPETAKITFFPHGLDQMFWEPHGAIQPGFNGLLARALVETPEGRRRYRERMAELTKDVFRAEALTNRLATWAVHVRNAFGEKNPSAARDYDGQVRRLRDLMVGRAAYLRKQLGVAPAGVAALKDGVARPAQWGMENDPPVAKLEQGPGPDGKTALSIRTGEPAVASWRCRLELPAGRYRFEGMVRTEGVEAAADEVGQGAGLRISGAKQSPSGQLSGTSPWRRLEFDFEVASPGEEVALVCELRAAKGRVWFDTASLKVTVRP